MITGKLLELVILNLNVPDPLGIKIVFGLLGQILLTRRVAADIPVRAVFTALYHYHQLQPQHILIFCIFLFF